MIVEFFTSGNNVYFKSKSSKKKLRDFIKKHNYEEFKLLTEELYRQFSRIYDFDNFIFPGLIYLKWTVIVFFKTLPYKSLGLMSLSLYLHLQVSIICHSSFLHFILITMNGNLDSSSLLLSSLLSSLLEVSIVEFIVIFL